MNMEIMKINVAIAVTGFAIAKKPPDIETIPIPMLRKREPFETCRDTAPSIILEIPTMTSEIPSNITKNTVASPGFPNTAAAKPIAIAPKTISTIRNHFGDFSWLIGTSQLGYNIKLSRISLNLFYVPRKI